MAGVACRIEAPLPFRHGGAGRPLVEGGDWTPSGAAMRDVDLTSHSLLVCLRTAEMDHHALSDVLDITTIEPDQFGAAEASCKADQEIRARSRTAFRSSPMAAST
jgi:hypothetical protein